MLGFSPLHLAACSDLLSWFAPRGWRTSDFSGRETSHYQRSIAVFSQLHLRKSRRLQTRSDVCIWVGVELLQADGSLDLSASYFGGEPEVLLLLVSVRRSTCWSHVMWLRADCWGPEKLVFLLSLHLASLVRVVGRTCVSFPRRKCDVTDFNDQEFADDICAE